MSKTEIEIEIVKRLKTLEELQDMYVDLELMRLEKQ